MISTHVLRAILCCALLLGLSACAGPSLDRRFGIERSATSEGAETEGFAYKRLASTTFELSFTAAPGQKRRINVTLPTAAGLEAEVVKNKSGRKRLRLKVTEGLLKVRVSITPVAWGPGDVQAIIAGKRFLSADEMAEIVDVRNQKSKDFVRGAIEVRNSPWRVRDQAMFGNSFLRVAHRSTILHGARLVRDGLWITVSVSRSPTEDQKPVNAILTDIIRTIEPEAPSTSR
ncbi:MAG: hypothetical protein MRY74_07130 [Neomegalonema sp.]|nr:hypothetical protein [Neomegalonema sp.]